MKARLFASLLVPLLALACTTGDQPSSEPASTPPSVTVESEPAIVSTTEDPEYFFAVASQVGVQHCPDGSYESEWIGVQRTLGWVTTSGPAEAELDAMMDLPVLARGRAGAAPPRPPLSVDLKPCPQMQMRSDWVYTPRGMRSRRTQPVAAEHFHISSVRRLDELKVVAKRSRVTASFVNPLPFALTDVRLRMHYEGCYGKPGATQIESPSVTLQPGEQLEHEFPQIDAPTPERVHRAAAIVLTIGGSEGPPQATVWADLDVSLYKLGLAFECD